MFLETVHALKDRDFCEVVEFLVDRLYCAVHVISSSTMEANRLDGILWTFKKEAFIPHIILGPGESLEGRSEKVFITVGNVTLRGCEVVIPVDLDVDMDVFKSYYAGIVFIYGDDENQKTRGRNLWRELKRFSVPRQYVTAREKNAWMSLLYEVIGNRR